MPLPRVAHAEAAAAEEAAVVDKFPLRFGRYPPINGSNLIMRLMIAVPWWRLVLYGARSMTISDSAVYSPVS